jgi:hypothetical protein
MKLEKKSVQWAATPTFPWQSVQVYFDSRQRVDVHCSANVSGEAPSIGASLLRQVTGF